jgi:transposase
MRHGKKGDGNDGGMGRSRGGLTSKIHALVDAEGRPVSLRLSTGQVADCKETPIELLGESDILLADKGYDTDAIRAKAAERKAWANIPPKANRKGSFSFSA